MVGVGRVHVEARPFGPYGTAVSAAEKFDPDDLLVPPVDVCAFCNDSECDGIGCIAVLDPNDESDHPEIERLHGLLRAGHAWEKAELALANSEGRDWRPR